MIAEKKKEKTRLFHLVKRTEYPAWKGWIIRIIAVVIALFIGSLVCAIVSGGASFGKFTTYMIDSVFGGSGRRLLNLFQNTAIMLIIALALSPAFKMKFWNIGAEGQVLMGALGSAICVMEFGDKVSEPVLLLIMFAMSVTFGIAWSVIPAIFKAQWNTNETLFTLMMNYVAMQIVNICIAVWIKSGSGIMPAQKTGRLPLIGGQNYILNIIIVAIVTVLMFIYFRFSKHGYELTVVGESQNTAKYVGINIKKVIIRTMVLGGVLCGLAGYLLFAGTNYMISADTVQSRGFTAILVAWLGKFNPFMMAFTSLLYTFIDQGSAHLATNFFPGSNSFSDIITGIFFFFVIGSEFFINYKIVFHKKKDKNKGKTAQADAENSLNNQVTADTKEVKA